MPGRRLLPLLLLCCSVCAHAQIYTWVDEKGQKHFGSQPPVAQQNVDTIDLHHGYSSDRPQPAVVAPQATAETKEVAGTADTAQKMCNDALRWTAKDLPNLKDIARERKQAGKLTAAQYEQTIKGLDAAKGAVTMQNCLASKGKDREVFECLAGGAGIMVCSGALEDALNKM